VTFTNNFWMDTTEVTLKHYRDLMSATYSGYTSPDWSGYGLGDNHPVDSINWYDAVLYCNARTKASGNTDTVYSYTSISGIPGNGCLLSGLSIDFSTGAYRLPTEAEWEYACRGGTATGLWWGSDTIGMSARVWSKYNSIGPNPVALKIANVYGLYDMIGNVMEWCNDWLWPYTSAPQTDPTGAASGASRVMRGGSWSDRGYGDFLSFNYRFGWAPNGRFNDVGFRCVCSRY
jgi:formylglycine-generating enzyme required for sulfatase activity